MIRVFLGASCLLVASVCHAIPVTHPATIFNYSFDRTMPPEYFIQESFDVAVLPDRKILMPVAASIGYSNVHTWVGSHLGPATYLETFVFTAPGIGVPFVGYVALPHSFIPTDPEAPRLDISNHYNTAHIASSTPGAPIVGGPVVVTFAGQTGGDITLMVVQDSVITASITYEKNPEFVKKWLAVSGAIKVLQTALHVASCSDDASCVSDIIEDMLDIKDVIDDYIDVGNYPSVPGVPTTPVLLNNSIFGAAPGPLDALIEVVDAGLDWLFGLTRKIADDPPDSNIHEVAAYSNTSFTMTGFGTPLDEMFGALLTKSFIPLDAADGVLHSLERLQGALIAGDDDAIAKQFAALNTFNSDFDAALGGLGEFMKALPDVLAAAGIEDMPLLASRLTETQTRFANGVPQEIRDMFSGPEYANVDWDQVRDELLALSIPGGGDSSLYEALRNTGDSFLAINRPVPEPATLALFAIALAGLGFSRRKRSAN